MTISSNLLLRETAKVVMKEDKILNSKSKSLLKDKIHIQRE